MMIDRMPNREIIELILWLVFWGQLFIFALLGFVIYRINQIIGSQRWIVKGISRLMGMTGE